MQNTQEQRSNASAATSETDSEEDPYTMETPEGEMYYNEMGSPDLEYTEDEEGSSISGGPIIHSDEESDEDSEEDPEDLEDLARPDISMELFYLWAQSQLGRYRGDSRDGGDAGFRPRRPRTRPDPNRFPKVPSDTGIELMGSGDFGTSELKTRRTTVKREKVAWRIMNRELGRGGIARHKANQEVIAQGMIPSSKADAIVNYDDPVYSGQFSDDGNFFYACGKDFKVRMYDTSNPYKWRYYKTVDYPFGSWTLTDASLSPDNRYLAYTSISSDVCLAPTDPNDKGEPYSLDLSDDGTTGWDALRSPFGIWSLRFSGDGKELIAGTSSNAILAYNIEGRQNVLEIPGHDDEVNAVCFADNSSSNILFSGSDDSTIKVWDRRSMGDSREAGAFVGHTEGITYIDSKGDGRYCLSNGKDQTMKLWDLRKMMSTDKLHEISPQRYSTNFDYRWGDYDEDEWFPHPYDNSVVTFRGHRVLRTLIRCHFSPPGSTNSRYVYSGSADGSIYVYNMDATLAGKIDVLEATRDTRPVDDMLLADDFELASNGDHWRTCVRDASWHPNAPVIAASSWNGYNMAYGTVTSHSWDDGAEDDEAEPKMGIRVDGELEEQRSYYQPQSDENQRARQAAGFFFGNSPVEY